MSPHVVSAILVIGLLAGTTAAAAEPIVCDLRTEGSCAIGSGIFAAVELQPAETETYMSLFPQFGSMDVDAAESASRAWFEEWFTEQQTPGLEIAAIPEPGSLLLIGIGLLTLSRRYRSRRR